MQITSRNRWLLVLLLVLATCSLTTYGKGGRGGGGRSSSSRGSSSSSRGSSSRGSSSSGSSSTIDRGRSRPAERPSYPAPAPRPDPKPPAPKPAPKPTSRSHYPPSPRPSAPEQPVVRQPAYNPDFKANPVPGSSHNQPPYNPNFKPDGPPPPYSPGGQHAPSAPIGPPPPYQPGSSGQLPPYPGPQVRPPAYPGLPSGPGSNIPQPPGGHPPYPVQPGTYPQSPGGRPPYPVQPGTYNQSPGGHPPYPVQPGTYPQAPGGRPYPVQPGVYPQSGVNRPYPVQPGSYPNQPGMHRPYPVQPGSYPQQPLGSNVWQPKSGMPAPAYMNYGGIPTGTNIYTKPHKKKGFLGSLMSVGKSKPKAGKNKYYGSYPSPYGGGMGHMGGGTSAFLGKHGNSAAMYTILPYMAVRKAPKFKPRFGGGYMPFFMPMPHYHHHHYGDHGYYRRYGYDDAEFNPAFTPYYDVYSNEYAGKCQQPIKKENSNITCNPTYKEITCTARCEEGYEFAVNETSKSNKCWHLTGVWRPMKNFPDCKPKCYEGCLNGGQCARPGICRCPPEYRGSRCQFHFLDCDVRKLAKGEKIGWVCKHAKNETSCRIRCREPAEFETPPADEYKCNPNGEWTPDKIPHCIIKEESENKT